MFKKAGLIVGGALIVVAIIIVLIASGSNDKGTEVKSAETVVTTTAVAAPVENTTKTPEKKSSVIQINSDTLPTPTTTTEIGVVQGKSMILLDNSLYYSVSMLIGSDNKQLMYIASEKGYNAVAVGEKCKVSLACYVTDNGSAYYAIQGIEIIE